jgi:hypothetical protein
VTGLISVIGLYATSDTPVLMYYMHCAFVMMLFQALEEALEEKALILARFEQDFEKLRTVNTDREQQLLDDFEWKLREVEQACKRRLEEKDKAVEERLKEGRKELELKLKLAEQQLLEVHATYHPSGA